MTLRIAPFLMLILMIACQSENQSTTSEIIQSTMDSIITRIYDKVSADSLNSIDDQFVHEFLSDDEKMVLATQYQYFTVNVPVTVSLMRDRDQKIVPFWIEPSGFHKTDMIVRNEEYTYEVWQKNFDAGKVQLGINGFDKHRPVYFISVEARDPDTRLTIAEPYPSYVIDTLKVGSFTYHDWSDLTLTEVPSALVGQSLFTTVRGRAREAHIVGAFRQTPFPSGEDPDQVLLTFTGSPATSINLQWRTVPHAKDGSVRFWKAETSDTILVKATGQIIADRLLSNDRYIRRQTAAITNLQPGTKYLYQISGTDDRWTTPEQFSTEPSDKSKFSLIWFGDTHCFPDSGKLVSLSEKRNPDASFYMIAGDIVSTGLYRDEWDRLFANDHGVFGRKPLMPVPGNHDRQDGLGAQLYYDLFSLPTNGPAKVAPESSYWFEYGNALFVMIDATSEVADHTEWLEQVLSHSKAKWKFAMFHFPPYNFEEPYPDIQKAWIPLFDEYHVDMVMGGHIHYYMRSNPMRDGQVVSDYHDGTVYTISISIPSKHDALATEPYAVRQYGEGYFYQYMAFDGNVMRYQCIDIYGKVRDEFTISK